MSDIEQRIREQDLSTMEAGFKIEHIDRLIFEDLERYKNVSFARMAGKYWRSLKDIAISFCKLERLGLCFIKGNLGSNPRRDLTPFDLQILKDLSNFKYLMISGLAKTYKKPIEDIVLSLCKLEKRGLCNLKGHYKPVVAKKGSKVPQASTTNTVEGKK